MAAVRILVTFHWWYCNFGRIYLNRRVVVRRIPLLCGSFCEIPQCYKRSWFFTVVILLPTSAPSFLPSPELSMFSAETTMTLSASESSFSDGVNSSSSLTMLELSSLLLVYPFLSSGIYFSKCATSIVSYVSDYDSTDPWYYPYLIPYVVIFASDSMRLYFWLSLTLSLSLSLSFSSAS